MQESPPPPDPSPAPHEPAAGGQPPGRSREFVLGALRTCGVLAGFVVFGLAWAATLAPTPRAGAPYPAAVPEAPAPTPTLWLIDGYNVVCANLLGGRDRTRWWSAEHRAGLLERLGHFDDPRAELRVVFDGAHPPEGEEAESSVCTVFADDADAWLLRELSAQPDPRAVAVVTSDRKVADRARHRGAQVVTPKALLRRCSA